MFADQVIQRILLLRIGIESIVRNWPVLGNSIEDHSRIVKTDRMPWMSVEDFRLHLQFIFIDPVIVTLDAVDILPL